MGVTTTNNKPLNPRAQDASPLAYNRAALYSGKALSFDGVNDNINLDGFTMAGTSATICFNGLTTGSNRYFFWVGGQNYGIINHDTLGFGVFDSVQWHYFGTTQRDKMSSYCIVNNGTTLSVYNNGVQIGSDATATAINWSSPSKVLLASNNAQSEFLNGQIAGFKVFNTALTAAQIADLYNFPEKIVPTGVDNTALKLWLPMMESAGTTAYDGSGNGNHGTISGATYVNGVGAPVAQTSVISWNKGTNFLKYSENMVTGWTLQNIGTSVNALESPDGLTTATKFIATAADIFHINNFTYASAPAGIWKESVFAKKGEVDFAFLVIRVNGGTDRYGVKFDLTDGTFVDDITSGSPTNTGYEITDAGNGWYKCTIQASHTSGNITNVFGPNIAGNLVDINGNFLGDGTSGMYFWGASLHPSTAGDSYVRTEATIQSTPVLLPAGLTTGRDITGVNLFENVRKQGALNLDGQSWAEVHDNASVDVTTGLSLEAWVYVDISPANNVDNIIDIFNKKTRAVSDSENSYILRVGGSSSAMNFQFIYDTGTSQTNATGSDFVFKQWYHVVGTFDSGDSKIYVNGSVESTASHLSTIITNNDNIWLGRHISGTGVNSYAPADIAQPRIYNRALTAEEVQRNYNAGKNIYS